MLLLKGSRLLISDQENLIEYYCQINEANTNNESLNPPKSAMKAQKNQRNRNDSKFPNPISLSIKFYDRPNNGVELPSLQVKNHQC